LFVLFFSLLVVFVAAEDELSEECQYVRDNFDLPDLEKVKACFNNYTMDQEVIDTIIKNLDIIQDLYPYIEIANNPPSEPANYFKKMDFKKGLADLKTQIAASNRVISKIIPPVQSFIKGFRDGHFGMYFEYGEEFNEDYYNMFTSIYGSFPFWWDVNTSDGYDEGERHVSLMPNVFLHWDGSLEDEVYDFFADMYFAGYYAETIDGVDAFAFLRDFFDEYNDMKSPVGRLYISSMFGFFSFSFIDFPLESLFHNHTIVFNDPNKTEFTFRIYFQNVDAEGARRQEPSVFRRSFASLKKEKENLDMIKNFKKRSVRADHNIVPCGLMPPSNVTNLITISSFDYFGIEGLQFMQELAECVDEFNHNDYPIVVRLPMNGGGSVVLEMMVQYMLFPASDFRTAIAARKTDLTKKLMVDEQYFDSDISGNLETCEPFKSKAEVEKFWKGTDEDKFGKEIHRRTKKSFFVFGDYLNYFKYYRLNTIRSPTEVIVLTDGYCFSACSMFVNNIQRTGSAIVAGEGLTSPDDVLFTASQCASTVIDPGEVFDELKNNSMYGLSFVTPVTETYRVSAKMDETIPSDYDPMPIDEYVGYIYDEDSINAVFEKYKTECNPNNHRMLNWTFGCDTKDPNAFIGGHPCGENGKWDTSKCRIAVCNQGYALDFENDKCVPNTCDPLYTPPPAPSPTVSGASSVALHSVVMAMAVLISFIHLVY